MKEKQIAKQSALDAANLDTLMKQAQVFLKSGLMPKSINRPEQIVVIAEVAKTLDIPAIHAVNSIHVINGKPCMSAELMRALIFRTYKDATFDIKENTDKQCVITAARPNANPRDFTFTIEMAKRAGLLTKTPWRQFPEAMLLARCTSLVARTLFPDVLMGIVYTPEEMGAEVEVQEDGTVTTEKLPPAEKPKDPEQIKHDEKLEKLREQIRTNLLTSPLLSDFEKWMIKVELENYTIEVCQKCLERYSNKNDDFKNRLTFQKQDHKNGTDALEKYLTGVEDKLKKQYEHSWESYQKELDDINAGGGDEGTHKQQD